MYLQILGVFIDIYSKVCFKHVSCVIFGQKFIQLFTNSYSLRVFQTIHHYDFLNTVHKKNHEQVRKLRLKIQEIPFNWEATAMQDLKKNRATKLCTTGKMEHNYDLGNSNEVQIKLSKLNFDGFFIE